MSRLPPHTRKSETRCWFPDIDKSRYARAVPLTPRARRMLDAICPDQGLIFRCFEYRRVLVQAARKVLATEHEARHLSAHDFRHAALTHMAAVGSDLTAIGHVAGHKNATTTALYVHNSEAAARRAVARRAGILDTEVDTEANRAPDGVAQIQPNSSESFGGPSWTRTRSQWIKKSHLRLAFPCETQGHGELAPACGVTERQRTTHDTHP